MLLSDTGERNKHGNSILYHNILYDLAAAIIPIAAVVIITIGIMVGFIVAIKNTFSVYKKVYGKKGK